MGKLKISTSLTGSLDGIAHSFDGTHSKYVSGHRMETYDVTTSYSEVLSTGTVLRREVLIVNDSAIELRVRWVNFSGDVYKYAVIEPGAHMEIHNHGADNTASTIYQVSVKSVSGTARVIVHQVWI